jgi:hypothetical protein
MAYQVARPYWAKWRSFPPCRAFCLVPSHWIRVSTLVPVPDHPHIVRALHTNKVKLFPVIVRGVEHGLLTEVYQQDPYGHHRSELTGMFLAIRNRYGLIIRIQCDPVNWGTHFEPNRAR